MIIRKAAPEDIDEIGNLYDAWNDHLASHINYPGWVMEYIIDLAEKESMKASRLDVYEKNIPAIRLYEKHGFQYIDTVDLGYSQYGLDRFRLYQYILKNLYHAAEGRKNENRTEKIYRER